MPLLLAAALMVASAVPTNLDADATNRDRRPNVLIIITDDQREGLDVMPKTRYWVGTRGRTYKHAYTTTPASAPARASIMTGRYAHNHKIRRAAVSGTVRLRGSLQAQLRGAGYRTALFGTYLHGWPLHAAPPHFDDWAISNGGYSDAKWNRKGAVGVVSGNNTDVVGDHAVDFIERRERATSGRAPWLMYVPVAAPRSPAVAERAYARAPVPKYATNPAMRERDRSDKPRHVRARRQSWHKVGARTRRAQHRSLYSADDLVNRLMSALRRTGAERDTLVIFTSDSGMLWGEHRLVGSDLPYSKAVRVPLLLRWPGKVAAGSVDRRLTANIDIAPTVLAAAGVRRDTRVDGRNLLAGSWERDRLLLEFWCSTTTCRRWASTRTKARHYIEYYQRGDISYREFYGPRDPCQLKNLYGDSRRANDPPTGRLSRRLAADRTCATARSCP